MPYRKVGDLPKGVSDHLPEHAKRIYMKAFNSAWDQYGNEESAHRVAWNAVKTKYHKGASGKWVQN